MWRAGATRMAGMERVLSPVVPWWIGPASSRIGGHLAGPTCDSDETSADRSQLWRDNHRRRNRLRTAPHEVWGWGKKRGRGAFPVTVGIPGPIAFRERLPGLDLPDIPRWAGH
jgi:hypothetical protein